MNKYIVISLLSLFIFSACNEAKFRIQGEITGLKDGTVTLQIFERGEEPKVLDSARVQNGIFVLEGTVASPIMAGLTFEADRKSLSVFVENSDISITGSVSEDDPRRLDVRVTGSAIHQAYDDMNAYVRDELSKHQEALQVKLEQTADSTAKAQIQGELDSLRRNYRNMVSHRTREYIRNNSNSPIAPYALQYEMGYNDDNIEEIFELFEQLPESAKSSIYYSKSEEKLGIFKQLSPGNTPPAFSLTATNDEVINLTALKGKVVLVDFWASWCVPCRRSFPFLKEAYAQYHDKGFEIVGISVDENKEAWFKALEEDELPWLNTHTFYPEKNRSQEMVKRYAVNHYPKTYLIDKAGKVVTKDVGHDFIAAYLKEHLEE